MVAKLWRFCLLCLFLSGCSSFSSNISMPWSTPSTPTTPAQAPNSPHQIALLLPQSGDYANAAKAIQTGFNDAYQQISNKPTIKVYDTNAGQPITALYAQAVSDGADFVIGPLEKPNVASLQNTTIKVITIALNSTDSPSSSSNFYQFALSPRDEAQQVADKAEQDGHHAALVITPAGPWGDNIATALQQRWASDGGTVVGSISVSNSTSLNAQIRQLLEVQGSSRRQDFDTIFMITQPVLARQIKPLLKFYYADNIPVYSSSLIYTGQPNTDADKDLDGVEFCDMPLLLDQQGPWAQLRQQFTLLQSGTSQQYIRLYGMGWDAALMTQHFNQLSSGIDGATGTLSVDNQQRITRQLPWAVFSDGMPSKLS